MASTVKRAHQRLRRLDVLARLALATNEQNLARLKKELADAKQR